MPTFFDYKAKDKPCLAFKVCIIANEERLAKLLKTLKVKCDDGSSPIAASYPCLGYTFAESTIRFKDADLHMTIYAKETSSKNDNFFLFGSRIILTDNEELKQRLVKTQPQAIVVNVVAEGGKCFASDYRDGIKEAVKMTGREILLGLDTRRTAPRPC